MSASPSTMPYSESKLVWQFFGQRIEGFFVDVGACHPKKASQSWFFEEKGWRGILVEPQRWLTEMLRAERPRSMVFPVACGPPEHPEKMPFHTAESRSQSSLVKNLTGAEIKYTATEMVEVMTLDEILAQAGNPAIDFLSIDVEGTQLDVLRGFSLERHRPPLLFVEDHLYNLRTHRYLQHHGYRLVKRTGLNNWYVPKGSPFAMSCRFERLRLWRKICATPLRKLRAFLDRRKAKPSTICI